MESIIQQGYSVKIGDYISRGWETTRQNLGGFIGFVVILVLINIGLAFLPVLGTIASTVISGPLNAGFFFVAFKIFKRQTTTFEDFFKGFNYFLPLFLGTLISNIFVVLGLVCLIIPGIYLGVAYFFIIPLILDKKMDFWPAMEASRKIVTKEWFSIFGLAIVLGLINFVGALLLGVGLLFTIPITICAVAAAYDDIIGVALPTTDTPTSL
ncbi:hypothetical protein DO97_07440 [Neosynechococcus sphagnicola sy1]|uniref:Integral membrane protein n=1 Tax=Neosynechococcus sphagnicola sy1 TaxID=1497020 RepID=A0A098TJU9_9CYAN|nr:hypothetical protein DO97_07440 [Neosynechococcus sphagnicola sy1]